MLISFKYSFLEVYIKLLYIKSKKIVKLLHLEQLIYTHVVLVELSLCLIKVDKDILQVFYCLLLLLIL